MTTEAPGSRTVNYCSRNAWNTTKTTNSLFGFFKRRKRFWNNDWCTVTIETLTVFMISEKNTKSALTLWRPLAIWVQL